MYPIPVLTPAQSAAWDQAAESHGVADATLMETAGRAVAQVVATRFAARLTQGVIVACGPGNNGGDGWVAARALHRLGAPVWVAASEGTASRLCGAAAERARADGVRLVAPDGPWPAAGLLLDAVLGTGAKGPPRGAAATLVARLADLHLPVVAVDGPSGLDLETGVQQGPLRATLTVTFGGYRRGHLLARDEVGDVVVCDIGFPPPDPAWPMLFTDERAMAALGPLPARSHKGDRGRVVIVGGDVGLTGAARLAARAAFAAGAGLVHVAAPEAAVATLSAAEPDIQSRVQSLDGPLTAEVEALIRAAGVVVIGPGLNRTPGRLALVAAAASAARAVILDADALTVLQGRLEAIRSLAAHRPVVMTPHLGEFRTLFPDLAADATVDPWRVAREAARASGAFVLLKGVPTVIATPQGHGWTVAAGNPGLATGGSGDTLSGLIATFLAQGLDTCEAAALGAQVLGRAADLAAGRHSARALRPMDVIAALPELWRGWSIGTLAPVRPPVLHELERPRGL